MSEDRPMMHPAVIAFSFALAVGQPLAAQPAAPPPAPPQAPAASWTPPRLPDGQPDVQGYYTAGGTVLVKGKEVDTRGGTYSITGGELGGGGTGEVEQVRKLKAQGKPLPSWPSKVIDPPDGQVPYQPWARAQQSSIEANVDNPTKQEHLDPQERCFLTGAVRETFHYEFELKQFPGYFVIVHDGQRIIPIGGGPHIDPKIKLWNSDSRGHWEGNTLVVDVANTNSKGRLDRAGNFASDKVHIVERYTFLDRDNFIYQATLDDPSVYTRPFTIASRLIRTHRDDPVYEHWEDECWEHEQNIKRLSADIDAAERAQAAKAGRSKR